VREERPYVFIGTSGYPRYRGVDLMAQPWTTYGYKGGNFGALARLTLSGEWVVEAGAFRSYARTPINMEPLLTGVNSLSQGTYQIAAAPPRDVASTSGEIRVSNQYNTDTVRNTFYGSVKARDRRNESGGSDTINYGPGTLTSVPQVPEATFNLRPVTVVTADQFTPALGYEGVWRDVGQLSAGVQKTFYHRTIAVPGTPVLSSRSKPWLYNIAGAGFFSSKFVVYASYTRGFEEVGNAPINAVNRDEAVPAQLTQQIDAGIKYQITPTLAVVAGAFEIKKPFFNLDAGNVFRQLGNTSNRGIEVSLTGNLTERFTIVAGGIFIDPQVRFDTGGGQVSAVAIGPIPGLIRANFQYRPEFLQGLTLDAKVERTSARDATALIRLPSVTTFDAGLRYNAEVFGRNVTARLQTFNLSNEYSLTPNASGQMQSMDGRRFEFSLAFDL
jgi:iron complex outermembrane receptor protein